MPRWLWVASGTSSRMRLDVAVSKARFEQPVGCRPAHEPLRARARVDAPRLDADDAAHALGDAAAIPIRVAISWVWRPVTGVRRSSGYCASMRTSARSACWRSTMCFAMCSASVSTRNASPITTVVDRLAEDLRKAGHVDAFLRRVEVDRARDLGGECLFVPLVPDADRLLHAGHARARQAEPDLGRRGLHVGGGSFRVCAIG